MRCPQFRGVHIEGFHCNVTTLPLVEGCSDREKRDGGGGGLGDKLTYPVANSMFSVIGVLMLRAVRERNHNRDGYRVKGGGEKVGMKGEREREGEREGGGREDGERERGIEEESVLQRLEARQRTEHKEQCHLHCSTPTSQEEEGEGEVSIPQGPITARLS